MGGSNSQASACGFKRPIKVCLAHPCTFSIICQLWYHATACWLLTTMQHNVWHLNIGPPSPQMSCYCCACEKALWTSATTSYQPAIRFQYHLDTSLGTTASLQGPLDPNAALPLATFMEILPRWNCSLYMEEHCSTASTRVAQCHITLASLCFLSWDNMWNKVVHFVSSRCHGNHNTILWRDMAGRSREQQPRSSLELNQSQVPFHAAELEDWMGPEKFSGSHHANVANHTGQM